MKNTYVWDLRAVRNLHYVHYSYHYSLHNNEEERIFQLLSGGSLIPRTAFLRSWTQIFNA